MNTNMWMYGMFLETIVLFVAVSADVGNGAFCGFPGSPASGTARPEKDAYEEGETVSYVCREGFTLMGSSVRKCEDDGEWTGEIPLCDDRMVTVGKSLSTETLPRYPSDMALDGDVNTCAQMKRKKPRWWRMDMGQRHHVMSVSISVASTKRQRQFTVYVVSIEGSNASYKRCASFNGRFGSKTAILSCAEAKGLEGQFVHIEDTNLQEDIFEICEVEVQVLREKYECGKPDREIHSLASRQKKGKVNYYCAQGYELDGSSTRECLPTGQWSGTAPKCRPVVCDGLKPIANGQLKLSVVNGNVPLAGTVATYGCDLGHVLIGDAIRVCLKDGEWGGTIPYCKAVDCGKPDGDAVRGVYKLLNRTTKYGAWAELRCRGYSEMEGDDPYIRCTLDGEWTEPAASCAIRPGAAVMPPVDSQIKNRGAVTFGMVVAVMMILIVMGTFYYVKRIRTPGLPPKPGQLPQPGDAIVPIRTPPAIDRSIPKPHRHRMPPYGEVGAPMPAVDEEKPEQLLENGVGVVRNMDSSWKSRSLPTDGGSTMPREHLYEEIGQARRSRSETLDSADMTDGGDEQPEGGEPAAQPLYSSIDVERKRFSRLNRSPESESPEPRTEDITDRSQTETPLNSTLDSETVPIQMRELPPIPIDESGKEKEDEEEESEEEEEEEEKSEVAVSPSKSPVSEKESPSAGVKTPKSRPTSPDDVAEQPTKTRDKSKQRPVSPRQRDTPTPPARDRSKQRPTSPKEQERTESPLPSTRDKSKQRPSSPEQKEEKVDEPAQKTSGRRRQRGKEDEEKKEEPPPGRVRARQRGSSPKEDEATRDRPTSPKKEEEPPTGRVRSRQQASPPKEDTEKEEEEPKEEAKPEPPAPEPSPPSTRRQRAARRQASETDDPASWRRRLRDKPYSYK